MQLRSAGGSRGMIEPDYNQVFASMCAGYDVRDLSAWIVAVAACLVVGGASAEPVTTVTLTRLACGESPAPGDVSTFSDTYAYSDFKFRLTFSCYLIRHGTEYMIWDTGNPLGRLPTRPRVGPIDQLRELKLRPEQIKYVVRDVGIAGSNPVTPTIGIRSVLGT